MLAVPNRTSLDPPSTRESQFQNVQRFRSGQEIDYRRELEFTLRPNSLGEGARGTTGKDNCYVFNGLASVHLLILPKGITKDERFAPRRREKCGQANG